MTTDPERREDETQASKGPRLSRERRTVTAMIRVYCRGRHGSGGDLCGSCEELRQYAMARLDRCPFGAEKPACAKCTIHCYRPEMRERVREVMCYAGPRMLLRHPILAIRHQADTRKAGHDKSDQERRFSRKNGPD